MSKFVFESKALTVEAYGQVYTLPIKTLKLVEELGAVATALRTPQAPAEQEKAIMNGIVAIIGEKEAARIFPVLEEADTDELSAFWLCLSGEYEKQARVILQKYSPERADRE